MLMVLFCCFVRALTSFFVYFVENFYFYWIFWGNQGFAHKRETRLWLIVFLRLTFVLQAFSVHFEKKRTNGLCGRFLQSKIVSNTDFKPSLADSSNSWYQKQRRRKSSSSSCSSSTSFCSSLKGQHSETESAPSLQSALKHSHPSKVCLLVLLQYKYICNMYLIFWF